MKTKEELCEILRQIKPQPEQPLGVVIGEDSYSILSLPNQVMIAETDEEFIALEHSEVFDTDFICQNAEYYYNKGEWDNAQLCIEQALIVEQSKEENEKDWKVYYIAGNIALTKRMFPAVVNLLACSLEYGCLNPIACYNRMATAYALMNQPQEAYACYQLALEIDPNDLETLHDLGGLYWDLGYETEAGNYYVKVLEIDPHHFSTHEEIGNLLKTFGQEALGNYFLECFQRKTLPLDFPEHLKEANLFFTKK